MAGASTSAVVGSAIALNDLVDHLGEAAESVSVALEATSGIVRTVAHTGTDVRALQAMDRPLETSMSPDVLRVIRVAATPESRRQARCLRTIGTAPAAIPVIEAIGVTWDQEVS